MMTKDLRVSAATTENIPPPRETCQSENGLLHRLYFVAFDVLEAVLVFAELLTESPLGMQRVGHVGGPGLRVGFGILEGDVVHQMVAIDAADSLDHVELIAVGMAHAIEPRLVIQIQGVRDQRVALPVPDRI